MIIQFLNSKKPYIILKIKRTFITLTDCCLKKKSVISYKFNINYTIKMASNLPHSDLDDQSEDTKNHIIRVVSRSHAQSNNQNDLSDVIEEHVTNHIQNIEDIDNLIPSVLHQIVFEDEENLLDLSDRTARLVQRQAYQDYLDSRNQDSSTLSTESSTRSAQLDNADQLEEKEEDSSSSERVVVLLDDMSLDQMEETKNDHSSSKSDMSVDVNDGTTNSCSINMDFVNIVNNDNVMDSLDSLTSSYYSSLIYKEEILTSLLNITKITVNFTEHLDMFILFFKIFRGNTIELKRNIIFIFINKSFFYLFDMLYQIIVSFFG